MARGSLEVKNLSKKYGEKSVLTNLSFSIPSNDFAVICGKPGNGKSVLVRLLMGLEEADSGTITVRGGDVTDSPPGSRDIGYIPQTFALVPHFSVRENIEYPLELQKATDEKKAEAVSRVAELLKISDLLEKKPAQLSGGQKQRVAIARGLAKPTDVYLLDDPLVGLDFKLRERLIDDLRMSQEQLGSTFLYVTSDALEALQLAKTVLVLANGGIVQQGALADVYDQPSHISAMDTLGFPEANFISGAVKNSVFESSILSLKTEVKGNSNSVVLGVRPESISLGKVSGALVLSAKVLLVENLGSEIVAYLDVSGVTFKVVVSRTDSEAIQTLNSKALTISIKPTTIKVFDKQSGTFLGNGVSLV
jgi:ABC-type sugar transport system ATPase subunit